MIASNIPGGSAAPDEPLRVPSSGVDGPAPAEEMPVADPISYPDLQHEPRPPVRERPKTSAESLIAEFRAMRTQERLSQAAQISSDTTPDNASRILSISREVGLPTSVVALHLDQIEKDLESKSFNGWTYSDSPAVQAWMASDPLRTAAAKDDLENLTGMEKVLRALTAVPTNKYEAATMFARAVAPGLEIGAAQNELAKFGAQLRDRNWWKTTAPKLTRGELGYISDLDKQIANEPQGLDFFNQTVFRASTIFGQMADMMANEQTVRTVAQRATAGMVAGATVGTAVSAGVFAPLTGLGGLAFGAAAGLTESMLTQTFQVEGGQSYLDLGKIPGIDERTRQLVSLGVGALNATFELSGQAILAAPFLKFGKRMMMKSAAQAALESPTTRKALMEFGKIYATNIGGESATEMMQEISTAMGEEIAKFGSNGDFKYVLTDKEQFQGFLQRVLDVGLQTAQGMLIIGLPGAGLNAGHTMVRAVRAQRRADAFKALGEGIRDSKTYQRNPEAIGEIVGHMGQDGEVKTLYVDPADFQEYFQSVGADPREAATLIFGTPAPLDQAVTEGGKIEIPTAVYAEKIAPTDANAFFSQVIREHPDAINGREGKAEAARILEVAQDSEKAHAEAEASLEAAKPTPEYEQVVQQFRVALEASGRYHTAAIETMAKDNAAYVYTAAHRLGITPAVFLEKYPLLMSNGEETTVDVRTATQASAVQAAEQELATLDAAPTEPGQESARQAQREVAVAKVESAKATLAAMAPVAPTIDPFTGNALEQKKVQPAKTENTETIRRLQAVVASKDAKPADREAAKAAIATMQAQLEQDAPQAVIARASLAASLELAASGQFPNNRALKVALQDLVQAAIEEAGVDLDLENPSAEAEAYLVRVGVADALEAMKTNGNAIGWYDTKVRRALSIMSILHPEIAKDTNLKFAFVFAMAVTSNGLKVVPNFKLAEKVYRAYKADGKMPTTMGQGNASDAMNESFQLFNDMVEKHGIDYFRRIFLTDFTVQQLTRMGYDISGELADQIVRGSAMIGPKIGNGFFSNLMGHFDRLTMDRWLMRTWGRWTGTLLELRPDMVQAKSDALQSVIDRLLVKENQETLAKLEEVLGIPVVGTPIVDLAARIAKVSVDVTDRGRLNDITLDGSPIGQDIRKLGNSLNKYVDGQKEAPDNGTERVLIRRTFVRILEQLRVTYPDMTMADLQALLWYPEKRLYDAAKSAEDAEMEASYADDEAPDYENAAKQVAADAGVGQRKIDNAVARADAERDAAGRAAAARRGNGDAEAGATDPGAGSPYEGLPRGEQRTFVARSLLAQLRSDRVRNGSAPRAYEERGRGDRKSVRILGTKVRIVASYRPVITFRNLVKTLQGEAPEMFELDPADVVSAPLFSRAITATKAVNKQGAAVMVYPVEQLAKMRLFITKDGSAGVALKGDDMVSGFSQGGGKMRGMLELAIEQGGRRADCFDTVLPDYYSAHGMVEVARIPWDEQEKPEDWNKSDFPKYNNGEPDVVFMVYDPLAQGPRQTAAYVKTYASAVRTQTRRLGEIAARDQVAQELHQAIPQTDTPAFKAWFGDSKVVDAQGQPLVVYHGTTSAVFDVFRTPSYFSENPEESSAYTGALNVRVTDKLRRSVSAEKAGGSLDGQRVQYVGIPGDVPTDGTVWATDNGVVRREKNGHTIYLTDVVTRKKSYRAEDSTVELETGDSPEYSKRIAEIEEFLASNYPLPIAGGVYPVYLSIQNPYHEHALSANRYAERFSGKDEWDTEVKRLEALGYDGIETTSDEAAFFPEIAEAAGDKVRQFIPFSPAQIKSATGNRGTFDPRNPSIVEQRKNDEEVRGRYNVQTHVLTLTPNANLSTTIHEFGHYILETMASMVANGDATPQIQSDFALILQHIGVEVAEGQTPIEAWNALSFEQRRPAHEKFAESNEKYHAEGKAPSEKLREVFHRIAAWMQALYRAAQNSSINIQLSDEVRGAFDRMYATDQEIEAASRDARLEPMFKDEAAATKAGLSPAAYAQYLKLLGDAKTAASDQTRATVMKEFAREAKAWWKEARAAIEKEVAAELDQQPVYQLLRAITTGKDANDNDIVPPMKLDRAQVLELKGEEFVAGMKGMRLLAQKDGANITQVAEQSGYSSADEMLDALISAPPREQTIKTETDARMKERYGDIPTDGSLVALAKKSLMDERQSEVALDELRMLEAKIRGAQPLVRQTRAEAQSAAAQERRERNYEIRWLEAEKNLAVAMAEGAKDAEIAALKQQAADAKSARDENARKLGVSHDALEIYNRVARDRIGALQHMRIKPAVYWAAARQAAMKAIALAANEDFALAAAAKTQHLLNIALYREAVRALEENESIVRYAKMLSDTPAQARLGKAGGTYLATVNAILDRYDFSNMTLKAIDKRASLAAFIQSQIDQQLPVNLPADVLDGIDRQPWKTLTNQELVGIRDVLKQITHLAQLKNRLLKAKKQKSFEAAVLLAWETITGNARQTLAPQIETRLSEDRAKKSISNYLAAHRKIGSLLRKMDGFKDHGPLWELFLWPLNDASSEMAMRQIGANAALRALYQSAYSKRDLRDMYTKRWVPALGDSVSKQGLLMMALNQGNAENKVALTDGLTSSLGREVTQSDVDNALRALDKRDVQFVQGMWDYLETFWPELSGLAERLDGIAPAKVEVTAWATVHGTVRGGYFPIVFDSMQDDKSYQQQMQKRASEVRNGTAVRRSTKAGARNERIGGSGKPLRLDFGVIDAHIEDVLMDITFTEVLIDVGRLLRAEAVQGAIRTHYGDAEYRAIADAIDSVAIGGSAQISKVESVLGLSWFNTGASIAGLGWNLTVSMLQPIGMIIGARRNGIKWELQGLHTWLRGGPKGMNQMVEFIHSKSDFMATRSVTMNRDVSDIRNTIASSSTKFARWIDVALDDLSHGHLDVADVFNSYFYLIGKMQMVADVPTWLGAYEKALAEGLADDVAVGVADQVVKDTQGSGQAMDLASVERGGPALKIWTKFYSYMAMQVNQVSEIAEEVEFRKLPSVGRMAADVMLVVIVPSVLEMVMRSALRGDEEKDPFLLRVGKAIVSNLLGMFVIARELSGFVEGFTGYKGPSGARGLVSVGDLVRQVSQGDLDAALFKALNDVGGVFLHYPSGFINRFIFGLDALITGKTHNPLAIFVGPPRKN